MPRRIVNTCSMRLTQSLAYPPPKLRVFDLVGLPPCIIGVFYKNCTGPYLRFSTEFAQGYRRRRKPRVWAPGPATLMYWDGALHLAFHSAFIGSVLEQSNTKQKSYSATLVVVEYLLRQIMPQRSYTNER